LEREWNTVEKIKSHPDMQKFVQWIQNKSFDKAQTKCSRTCKSSFKQSALDN
jgi:hypothetical protein